jgi:cysteine dioxygenase
MTYKPGEVTYMSDSLGLHRVQNASSTECAVSLHLYTVNQLPSAHKVSEANLVSQPPNAAKHGCHIFDESTGKKSHVSQSHFYSEFGVKI